MMVAMDGSLNFLPMFFSSAFQLSVFAQIISRFFHKKFNLGHIDIVWDFSSVNWSSVALGLDSSSLFFIVITGEMFAGRNNQKMSSLCWLGNFAAESEQFAEYQQKNNNKSDILGWLE